MTLIELAPSGLRPLVEKILAGQRVTTDEALALYNDAPLGLLGVLATRAKEQRSGKSVFYNRNFHIEPTNICAFHCKFCSYRRPADAPDAWRHSMEQVLEQAAVRRGTGVTEVHIVGGADPLHDLYYYTEMIRRVREILPRVTVKAFSAVELDYMIAKAGLTLCEGLTLLKEAGMETMPGGGAEIFDEGIRARICGEKSSSARWLEVHRTAHGFGMPTNATMLYGHVERPEHRVDHLDRLRSLQDETGGFNAFIPLKYRSAGNELSAVGEVSVADDLRTLALSRLFLDNFAHLKAYWPMYGRATTQLALAFGADDIDGTIDDTTRIFSMAGADDTRPSMGVDDLRKMIVEMGYTPVERDSFYRPV